MNAQPDYRQSAEQQTQSANQPISGYEQNRNPQNGTELPGASQQMKAQPEREKQAEEHQREQPTLVGCLVSGAEGSEHGFFLAEKKSGARYRLKGSEAELKDHLNHLVEVVGKPESGERGSKAVAAKGEAVFDVGGIQDLAPTCGASR